MIFLMTWSAEEAERVVQCNGRVFCLDDERVHRVWLPNEESPGLAMSRAFGDYCLKDFGLISVPEVTRRQITVRDQFIVLASDGVRIILFLVLCLKNNYLFAMHCMLSFNNNVFRLL